MALLWAACCLALAWRAGLPSPGIHDEFSYLLGADTFAHGRLANPPHQIARFFESPHILMRPAYASMYPPGQALFLALGQKLLGAPYYGVVLSGIAMMFLLTMSLVVWSTPGAGIATAIVLGLQFLPPMYWAYSYWGGFVAAAGGAAALLSVALYQRRKLFAAGIAFGAGVLVLFLTRPYEGGVLMAAGAVVCGLAPGWRNARAQLRGAAKFILAACPILAAGLLWTGWYNTEVTGSPFLLPHVLHAARYNTAPVFWILPLTPAHVYSNARLAAQHGPDGFEVAKYKAARIAGWLTQEGKATASLSGAFGMGLALLALAPFAWRDRRVQILSAIVALTTVGLSIETFHFPHYTAPLTGVLAVLAACAAQTSWRHQKGALRWGAILTCFVFAVAGIYPLWSAIQTAEQGAGLEGTFGVARAGLIRRLSKMDGDQLVIVRYPWPAWKITNEWVYNGADIDAQKVVFAHDLGAKENKQLLNYYPSRHAWLLTFSGDTAHLRPYTE